MCNRVKELLRDFRDSEKYFAKENERWRRQISNSKRIDEGGSSLKGDSLNLNPSAAFEDDEMIDEAKT